MFNLKKTKIAKITSGIVGVATAIAMFGGAATAFAAEDVAAQIAALMAQIQMLQAKLAAQPASTAVSFTFSKNLTVGSTGDDVMNLQKALNGDADTMVALSGNGSKGMETKYFGPATKAAVMKFQTKYGISPVAGYFGPMTRAKMNSLMATVAPTTPAGTPIVTTGGGLVVAASAQQPVNQLAPKNATNIPFTKLTLTAGANDVAINGIVVERTGSSVDAALSGVVLLDEMGSQIGIAKTLNSSHRATVGDPLVIKAGTTRTFIVAGNRPDNADNGGTIVSLDVVGINTSATISGDVLPIRGASHTINTSLTVGSVTMQRGGIDPGASQTKEIGTAGYLFSSVKVTAGSQESLTLKSIRWNQTGSVGSGDLANVKTLVDGVSYDTMVSSDGKYYTANFGNGILIDKGFSKDISIKGDIIGGSNRTIDFDIAKKTDISLVGNLYGYGVLPPQTGASVPTADTSAFSSSEDPWYDASQVLISAGTITVSSDTAVSAQNIAVNLSNQPFGGWTIELRGEPISVGGIKFNVLTTGSPVSALTNYVTDLTNVSLVDQDGKVLAGPVDGKTAGNVGTIEFTDTITFPIGITRMTLKGKVGTGFATDNSIRASTTPSSQWTSVKGQVTGNTIGALPTSAITGSQMTVKAGALAISVESQPVSQFVIAGANQFGFARYSIDATQSGEDIRVTSIPLQLTYSGISATNLSNCQLYDVSTSVTTGSNSKNPSVASASSETFTFDGSGLIVSKGTKKILTLKCNVTTGVTGSAKWGLDSTQATAYTGASGVTSGQTIAETMTNNTGNLMTLATSGSYTVSGDSSATYNYRAVRANTEVLLGAFKFNASPNEDLKLMRINLKLGSIASSSKDDLVNGEVSLWDGTTKVGTATFDTNGYATSSLLTTNMADVNNNPVVVAKNDTKVIVIKGLLSKQGNYEAGTPGSFLIVNYDGNSNGQTNGNYAVGKDSGSNISGPVGDITTNGVRIFANTPVFALVSSQGTFTPNVGLYKVKVSNPGSKDMALAQLTFSVSTTSAATGFTLWSEEDGAAAAPVIASADTVLKFAFSNTNAKVIPANSSKTYSIRVANLVDNTGVSDQVTFTLLSDTNYPSLTGRMGTATGLKAGNNIVWSPVSTTTESISTAVFEGYTDWTVGIALPGFSAAGATLDSQSWTRPN